MDSGKVWRIEEATSTQVPCDKLGQPFKPFDPRITGRYNYEDRQAAILRSKADMAPVELPDTLKHSLRRIYAPQQQRLNGYAQMPRMLAAPYSNKRQLILKDGVMKRRAERATNSAMRVRSPQKMSIEVIKTTLEEQTGESPQTKTKPEPS